eukprot:s3280_g6.t1
MLQSCKKRYSRSCAAVRAAGPVTAPGDGCSPFKCGMTKRDQSAVACTVQLKILEGLVETPPRLEEVNVPEFSAYGTLVKCNAEPYANSKEQGDVFHVMSSTKWMLRLGILRLVLLFQVVHAQDYVYEKDITSSADCQTAATDGEGNWIGQIDSALFPSGCSYEFGSGDIHYNIKAQGSDLYPDGTTYAIICRQSTTTVTTVTTTTTSSTSTSTSSTSTSSTTSSTSSSTSSSSTSTSSTSTSSTSSSTTSTSSSTFTSTSTTSSSTSSTSTSSTTTTTSTTPPDIFNVTWAESYVRPVKNTEIALSCYPTSCNEHAVAFLAAIDHLSLQLVDTSCDFLTETPQQPLTVYDSMSARVVVKTTTPNYLYPQEGSSPIEPVVAWTVNWTLQVVEGQELRMGRSYRLCVDTTGPGGYNGLQLSDVQDMFEVYVAGIRSVRA